MTATEASVAAELAAMRKLHQALEPLDPDAQARVLRWLTDRYATPIVYTATYDEEGAPE